jgi:hypothetical protein
MAALPDKETVIRSIRKVAAANNRAPSRAEFRAASGMTEYQVLRHFDSWREAVRAAGLEPDSSNIKLDDSKLLEDWGQMVRQQRHIPTRDFYRKAGRFSVGVFEKHFGPWSAVPAKFRGFAADRAEWADVVALLPVPNADPGLRERSPALATNHAGPPQPKAAQRHSRLDDRPTYGNPIDFRGVRHEPVNENGVVLLFGMVARELGYLVEAVQAGFPDCEAKRQIEPGRWQRVRIEFEYESRNFRDHGHSPDGCDLIVCWRHNWTECPVQLEVLELRSVITTLAATDE